MKLFLSIALITAIVSNTLSGEREGLYIPLRDVEPTYELGEGEIEMRIDAE